MRIIKFYGTTFTLALIPIVSMAKDPTWWTTDVEQESIQCWLWQDTSGFPLNTQCNFVLFLLDLYPRKFDWNPPVTFWVILQVILQTYLATLRRNNLLCGGGLCEVACGIRGDSRSWRLGGQVGTKVPGRVAIEVGRLSNWISKCNIYTQYRTRQHAQHVCLSKVVMVKSIWGPEGGRDSVHGLAIFIAVTTANPDPIPNANPNPT